MTKEQHEHKPLEQNYNGFCGDKSDFSAVSVRNRLSDAYHAVPHTYRAYRAVISNEYVDKFASLSDAQQNKVLEITFERMQDLLGQNEQEGSTVSFFISWFEGNVVKGKGAYVGESIMASFILDQNKKIEDIKKFSLTHNLKSNEEEKKRVTDEGGPIFGGRLFGVLPSSRSIGYTEYDRYGLSHNPSLITYSIPVNEGQEVLIYISSTTIADDLAKIGQVISSCTSPENITSEIATKCSRSGDKASVITMTPGFSGAVIEGLGGDNVSAALDESFYTIFHEVTDQLLSDKCSLYIEEFDARCRVKEDALNARKINSIRNKKCFNEYVSSLESEPFKIEVTDSSRLSSSLKDSSGLSTGVLLLCPDVLITTMDKIPDILKTYPTTQLKWIKYDQSSASASYSLILDAKYAFSEDDKACLNEVLTHLTSTYIHFKENIITNSNTLNQYVKEWEFFHKALTIENNSNSDLACLSVRLFNRPLLDKIRPDTKEDSEKAIIIINEFDNYLTRLGKCLAKNESLDKILLDIKDNYLTQNNIDLDSKIDRQMLFINENMIKWSFFQPYIPIETLVLKIKFKPDCILGENDKENLMKVLRVLRQAAVPVSELRERNDNRGSQFIESDTPKIKP